MNMTLSIVIPTIGRIALEKTIASVIGQNVMPDEIIVWDNSGTGAAKQNSEYADHPLIKWRVAEKQKTIVDSWNTAVEYCSGDFVYILGDDDIMLPDFVKICKELLASGSQLIHIENQFIDGNGDILSSNDRRTDIIQMSKSEFLHLFSSGNEVNIYLSSLIFPLQKFREIGGFKDIIHNGLAMDVLFNFELLHEFRKITVVFSPLWQYRIFISDWCGAVKDPAQINKVALEYLQYRQKMTRFFADEPKKLFHIFNKRRVTSQIIGVCYPASPWKTFLLIFSGMFSLREKFSMLRDILYMVRHKKA